MASSRTGSSGPVTSWSSSTVATWVSQLITETTSPSPRLWAIARMVALTMSIGWPVIEPEESTEKVSARARRGRSSASGATTPTSTVYSPSPLSWTWGTTRTWPTGAAG